MAIDSDQKSLKGPEICRNSPEWSTLKGPGPANNSSTASARQFATIALLRDQVWYQVVPEGTLREALDTMSITQPQK